MGADIAKLSVGREAYDTRELATDHEQYLSGHGESPGRWYGAGARSLGLQGEASVAGFQAMFEGRHPDTRELLGRPHGRNAVPGFDVVLRPTKSVSIFYGLGDLATGRAVLAAHHAGLAGAAARGVDPDSLVREVTGRTPDRDQDQTVSADVTVRLFDRLAGPGGLTEGASTFTRPEIPGGLAVATQQVNRAHDLERELRQHQQRRAGWREANAHLGPQYRQVVRALAWRRRATGLAVEADRPGYALEALGPVPASTRGRRAWRQAAAEIEQYRHTYHITDPDRALGPEPHDPGQRADRQRARTAIDRVQAKQRAADRTHERQPTRERTSPPRPRHQRGRQGPERAAG